MSDCCKLILSPFTRHKKQKAWNKTREKYMLVKRKQIETNKGSYDNKEDGQKYFQTVKVNFSMVMKVMIVITMMRIITKIMNSSSYLRFLPIIATKQFQQLIINDFAVFKCCSGTLLLVQKQLPRCFVKSILRNHANSQENTCIRVFFKIMFEKLYFCKR